MLSTLRLRVKPLYATVGIVIFGVVLFLKFTSWTPSKPVTTPSLTEVGRDFYLDGKQFRILSGSIHYFRVVPEYWKDRLLKLKAMSLNTVQTYVPWNLHEEVMGHFNFEGGLDIARFINLAHTIGLYVIVRPGPFICAEWEFGGFPSWLLHDPNMELRSMYTPYILAVDRYLKKMAEILAPLQYSKGGPIIAFQVENEYGGYSEDLSSEYMIHLRNVMVDEGLTELMFTSDNLWIMEQEKYRLPGAFLTMNLQKDEVDSIKRLKKLQPNRPLMVAEFWPGWFDNWGDGHHKMDVEKTTTRVLNILKAGASINLYMFHGGTNFGFMNGALVIPWIRKFSYQAVVTSYDYDAPLSEAGDVTKKFWALSKIFKKYNPSSNHKVDKSLLYPERRAYGNVKMQKCLGLSDMTHFFVSVESDNVMPMEMLPINNNGGQGYGFILYRTELWKEPWQITIHDISDSAQVLLDGSVIYRTNSAMKKGTWKNIHYLDQKELWKVVIKLDKPNQDTKKHILEILVENMGRSNILPVMNTQRKGILGDVFVDGKKQSSWKIYPMEFKRDFFSKLSDFPLSWKKVTEWNKPYPPTLYRGTFDIKGEIKDTFLHMKDWTKGVAFINGHNLGRYWELGPQETLYLPAPWLRRGNNELLVFELEKCKVPEVSFSLEPKIKGETVDVE